MPIIENTDPEPTMLWSWNGHCHHHHKTRVQVSGFVIKTSGVQLQAVPLLIKTLSKQVRTWFI